MQRQTTRQTKIASCVLLTLAALTLAGCGNHGQADSSGTMTQDQIKQNAQKQNDYLKNHPPSNAAPPATSGTPGH